MDNRDPAFEAALDYHLALMFALRGKFGTENEAAFIIARKVAWDTFTFLHGKTEAEVDALLLAHVGKEVEQ
jgi:hypothetical protein